MALIRDFIFGTDPEYGSIGFLPAWMPDANYSAAVAHDMLEHFAPARASAIEDELEAFGALLALRVEHGATSELTTPEKGLALNVASALRDIVYRELEAPAAIRAKRLGRELEHAAEVDWAERVLCAAARDGVAHARSVLLDEGGPEALPECFNDLPALEAVVRGYLRRGYRRALRRYRGRDRYWVAHQLFRRLDKAAETLMCRDVLSEGDRVRFVVNLSTRSIFAHINGRRAGAWSV